MENTQPTQGLYDIYDLIYVPFWQTKIFFIALTIGLLGTLLVGIWWYFKKKRDRALTSWEEALRQLDLLRPDEQTTHLFYEQLTNVVKKYLTHRYNYPLLEKTDEEVAIASLDIGLPKSVQPPLQEIFSRAVAYKFGRQQASLQQMTGDVQATYTLIKQTIPQEKGG